MKTNNKVHYVITVLAHLPILSWDMWMSATRATDFLDLPLGKLMLNIESYCQRKEKFLRIINRS